MSSTDPTALYTLVESPIGELLLVGDGGAITGLYMQDGATGREVGDGWTAAAEPFAEAKRQLEQYFAGERTGFDLPLAPAGTPFQLSVWDELQRIPHGETRSYREVAAAIGRPRAVRAVGAANGRNPNAVIVPCHRVIGADGSLVGFGGGVERKRLLLELERPDRRRAREYTLIGADGRPYRSTTPGQLGGHRRNKGYGRLDCPSALRWIEKGKYVSHRVFFADERTAVSAGYRPCATCLPERYREWKRDPRAFKAAIVRSG